jgi:hypothetical protein|tara:strand:+ start:277 stop:1002 length:726 start_codon:yes stop_codon:yes gene_type:complete
MYSIKKCEDIDIEQFNFQLPKKLNNKYISSVLLDDKSSFIQLKNVKTLSGFYNIDGKYKIDIILDDESYYNFFMNLEMLCIHRVHQHYPKWFGIESDGDTLDSSFISFLKLKGMDTILTLPIELDDDELECEVYNSEKQRVSCSSVKQDDIISLIIRFNGIQFSRNKFATYWSISQIKINKEEENIGLGKLEKNIYHFIESSSDSESYNDDDDIDYLQEHEYIVENLTKNYKTKELLNNIN